MKAIANWSVVIDVKGCALQIGALVLIIISATIKITDIWSLKVAITISKIVRDELKKNPKLNLACDPAHE